MNKATRISTYLAMAIALAALVALLSSQHYRWLMVNGMAATELSKQLLAGQISDTPAWAVNLVVTSSPEEQVVTFSEHQSEFAYMFSPNAKPLTSVYVWRHLIGSWYVGKSET